MVTRSLLCACPAEAARVEEQSILHDGVVTVTCAPPGGTARAGRCKAKRGIVTGTPLQSRPLLRVMRRIDLQHLRAHAGMAGGYPDVTDSVAGLEEISPAEVNAYLASPEALISLAGSPSAALPASAAPAVRATGARVRSRAECQCRGTSMG